MVPEDRADSKIIYRFAVPGQSWSYLQTKHQIYWDSATRITYSTNCYQRPLKKAGLLT